MLDLLSSLVSRSLLVAETVSRAQARYYLLETIREYARNKLVEAGEMAQLRERHLNLFLIRAEEAAPKLQDAYQQLWLNWLESEHDNLRAALAWALDSDQIEEGLRIANALIRFWEIRGYVREGLSWFEQLLAQAGEALTLVVHANAQAYASFLAMFLGDASTALDHGRKAVALAEAAGDEGSGVLAIALAALATGARVAGDFQTAFTVNERVIQLYRASPRPHFFLGMALLSQGSVAIELGDYETAHSSLNESLAIAREAGDSFRVAHALNALGDLARCQQRYEDAQAVYENSITLLREVDAQHDLAAVLQNLGHACLHLGDVERAQLLFRESMAAYQALQHGPGMAESLIGLAAVAVIRGLPAAGARLLGAVAASGPPMAVASVWQVTRLEYEYYLDLARTSMSEAEFQAEQAAGQAMSMEQAVDYALNLQLEASIAPVPKETSDSLTEREREVAALVGLGKTNGEIAADLVLSKRTVETHINHILSKLNLSNRGQLMRWAIDRGLAPAPA